MVRCFATRVIATASPARARWPLVARGVLYSADFAGCHGEIASGNAGPNIQDEEASDITGHTRDGHDGHATFDLSSGDISDIAAYLAAL
jgi:mono/diheme cytochrome c family protein